MDIKFGRVNKTHTVVTEDGTITRTDTMNISDFKPDGESVTYVERKRLESDGDILVHILNTLDRYKAGEMSHPAFVVKERGGKPIFLEIVWSPKK